jgi:hypothetical protein
MFGGGGCLLEMQRGGVEVSVYSREGVSGGWLVVLLFGVAGTGDL